MNSLYANIYKFSKRRNPPPELADVLPNSSDCPPRRSLPSSTAVPTEFASLANKKAPLRLHQGPPPPSLISTSTSTPVFPAVTAPTQDVTGADPAGSSDATLKASDRARMIKAILEGLRTVSIHPKTESSEKAASADSDHQNVEGYSVNVAGPPELLSESVLERDGDSDGDDDDESIADINCKISDDNTPQCQPVGKSSNSIGRHSEATMKVFAMKTGIMEPQWSQPCKCRETTNPGQCMMSVTVHQVKQERIWLFGPPDQPPPTGKEKTNRMKDILDTRVTKGANNGERLIKLMNKETIVCENAFLVIAGLSNSLDQRKPKKWQEYKKHKDNPNWKPIVTREDQAMKLSGFTPKQDHAFTWLHHVAKHASDLSVNADESEIRVIPFSTVPEMWRAYYSDSIEIYKDRPSDIAGYKTFSKMWNKQSNYVKYRSKGTFATCSCCNMANKYLTDYSKFNFSEHDKNILRSYRRKHLQQQEDARKRVDTIRNRCKIERDAKGNPASALFFIDAMSTWAGKTPKAVELSGRTNKSDTGTFTDRVMGCEITCLDIDIFVLYHSDELAKGGANFMIEIQRLAFYELKRRLNERGLDMPRRVYLQYDNCSENKNKYMFMYLSLLVELSWFDEIEVGFLVVGHTHAPIDQKYSAIKSRLKNAKFIASPPALWRLLRAESGESFYYRGKESDYVVPAAQYKVSVVHDYKSALEPYFEKAVSRYNIPFNFRIRSIGGIAIVEAQMFVGGKWFPEQPKDLKAAGVTVDNIFEKPVFSISPPPLTAIGGPDKLFEDIGVQVNNLDGDFLKRTSVKKFMEISALNRMIPALQAIENRAYCAEEIRFEAVEHAVSGDGMRLPMSEDSLEALVNKQIADEETEAASVFNRGDDKELLKRSSIAMASTLAEHSSSAEGWLTFFSATARGSLPALSTVKPKRMNPFEWVTISKGQKRGTGLTDEVGGEDDDAGEESDGGGQLRATTGALTEAQVIRVVRPRKEFKVAVQDARAAANQALQRIKDNQFVVAKPGSPYDPGDSTLHERFTSSVHLIYPVDKQFYEDHETVAAMATKFEVDIDEYERNIEPNGGGFEWFIAPALTQSEIEMRDRVMVARADSAVKMVEMCEQLYLKNKHIEDTEILSRFVNDAQRKKELQLAERAARTRVAQERKEANAKETEEKNRQKNKVQREKAAKRMADLASNVVFGNFESQTGVQESSCSSSSVTGAGQRSERRVSTGGRGTMKAADGRGHVTGGRGRNLTNIAPVSAPSQKSTAAVIVESSVRKGNTGETKEEQFRRRQVQQALLYGEDPSNIVPYSVFDRAAIAAQAAADAEKEQSISIDKRKRKQNISAVARSSATTTTTTTNVPTTGATVQVASVEKAVEKIFPSILKLSLPGISGHDSLVKFAHKALLTEVRKAVATLQNANGDQTKRRRLVTDPVALTEVRLCSELMISTNFYKPMLPSLVTAFHLENMERISLPLETESQRGLFVREFCIAMHNKYGGNSLQNYLTSLESMEFD